jgi:hypothetical protein
MPLLRRCRNARYLLSFLTASPALDRVSKIKVRANNKVINRGSLEEVTILARRYLQSQILLQRAYFYSYNLRLFRLRFSCEMRLVIISYASLFSNRAFKSIGRDS